MLDKYEGDWAPQCLGPFAAHSGNVFGFSRGFVSRITCTSADWLQHHKCEDGRIPRPCPATAQPIERVVLTTEPDWEHWNPVFSQTEQAFYDDRWPGIVFEVRAERETRTRRPIHAHGARGYSDRQQQR